MLRKIQVTRGHPAGGLDALCRHVVIGVLFVMTPRIVTQDRVDLEQAEQKNQPGAHLDPRHVVERMIRIVQIKDLA